MVTEVHVCEQLAQSSYLKVERSEVEPAAAQEIRCLIFSAPSILSANTHYIWRVVPVYVHISFV